TSASVVPLDSRIRRSVSSCVSAGSHGQSRFPDAPGPPPGALPLRGSSGGGAAFHASFPFTHPVCVSRETRRHETNPAKFPHPPQPANARHVGAREISAEIAKNCRRGGLSCTRKAAPCQFVRGSPQGLHRRESPEPT